MRTFPQITILLLSLSANSQNYGNQGEQEDAWTKDFFQDKYEKQDFTRCAV